MTKVVLGMSTSLDGIAGPESADADGMAIFMAILGWQFPLRSWREQQGQEGGEDSVDSRVWADNFARFGPQVVGRTMFDYGYPNWGENPPFHAPVVVVTHRGQERIDKSGGTCYTFVTDGIKGRRRGGPRGRGRQGRVAGRWRQHCPAGAGCRAGRRGGTARRAEAGRPGRAAVRPGPGGSASHRDHPWRGSGPPPLRNRVKRPYLITDTAWNSASRPSFGSKSGVQSWHHGSFGMSTPAETGAAGSQGRRPSRGGPQPRFH
jgi:dihydrofolate reductase